MPEVDQPIAAPETAGGPDGSCLHGPTWVVDMVSRKVVRRPCRLCYPADAFGSLNDNERGGRAGEPSAHLAS
jgi:hypothetical protein